MTEMTEEQTRLVIRLGEMLVADNWRGIAAHEGAALALVRDLRVADPEVAGFILSALGNAHGRLGGFSQAIAYHTQCLAIAREVGDREWEGKAGHNLGLAEQMRLATRLNEMQTADNWRGIVEQEGAALALARDVRVADPRMAGAILSKLGLAHYSLGNFSQAIAYHTQHLAIAREVGDRAGEVNANGNLGIAHESMGDFSQAIAYHKQCLEIAREVGDRAREGTTYGNLGNAHYSLGDFSQAIAYHTQHLEIAREVGDRAGEGNANGNLGGAHNSMGNFSQAIAYHTQHLEIAREVGDRPG